jgi:hypothetical protein
MALISLSISSINYRDKGSGASDGKEGIRRSETDQEEKEKVKEYQTREEEKSLTWIIKSINLCFHIFSKCV